MAKHASKTTAPSTTAQIRAFLKPRIAEADMVDAPELARECHDYFRHDTDFMLQFIREHLYAVIYDNVQKELSATRHRLIPYAGGAITREHLEQQATVRWQRWMENVPSRKAAVRLIEMTREDLMEAAHSRRDTGLYHMACARFFHRLAQAMRAGERVGERYTEADLERIREELGVPPID